MSEEDRPGYSFRPGPPPEASAFLRRKGLVPSFTFEDVEGEEHAVGFAISGVTELDILADVKALAQRALDEGQTIETFRRGLREGLERRGWWGPREVVDPLTGERRVVDLSAPHRVRTIYRANLRAARAAGQWEQIERTAEALPWLEYRLGPSEVHRPEHAALEGTILPVDDPFWRTHFPPNGWGCRCWVRQLSARQAERRGGVTPRPEVLEREVVNRRTGERRVVPVGVDPGWDRNPGLLRRENAEALLAGRVRALTGDAQRAAAADIAGSWRVERMLAGAPGRVPVAVLPEAAARAIGAESPVVDLSTAHVAHLVGDHPGEDRATLVAQLAALPRADRALVVPSPGGQPTLHLQMDAPAEQSGSRRVGGTLHAIIWLEGGPVLRTVFASQARYFERLRRKAGAREIDLSGGG